MQKYYSKEKLDAGHSKGFKGKEHFVTCVISVGRNTIKYKLGNVELEWHSGGNITCCQ